MRHPPPVSGIAFIDTRTPDMYFITSTIAAVAACCVSIFMFFWALLCLFYGGPEGVVGSEAITAGLVSAAVSAITGYATYVFIVAPKRVEQHTATLLYRVALKGSPLFALLFIGMLWMLGTIVLVYFAMIAAVTVAVRLTRRR
ncbi:MAG: hypothetical protein Q7U94_00095 [Sideroxyarcus sp.]|nr:hypothetical protein [Sideroxyarcus sp.]